LGENLPNKYQMRCTQCNVRIPICDLRYPESRDREQEYDPTAPMRCWRHKLRQFEIAVYY
jgi:hypothetical protein